MSAELVAIKGGGGEKSKKDDIVFGDFWTEETNNKGKIKYEVSPYELTEWLVDKGLRKMSHDEDTHFVRIKGNIVELIPPSGIYHIVIHNVKEMDEGELKFDGMATALYSGLVGTMKLLVDVPLFDKDSLLSDTHNQKYFFYKNKIIQVSKGGKVEYIDYDDAPGLVWKNNILDREIVLDGKSEGFFKDFIGLITAEGEWRRSVECAMGFMMHKYKDPTRAKMIAIYEESQSATGGTGKSLIAQATSKVVTLIEKNGKNWKPSDDNCLDGVNETTNIFYLDDLKEGFKLEAIYPLITTGSDINGKYRKRFFLPFELFPKVVTSSNHIIECNTGSDKRRIHEIFINNHFSPEHTPLDEFGEKNMFWGPGWSEAEWSKFDNYMIHCAKQYFKHGLFLFTNENLEQRKVNEKSEDIMQLVKLILMRTFDEHEVNVLYANPASILFAGEFIFQGQTVRLATLKQFTPQKLASKFKEMGMVLLGQRRIEPWVDRMNPKSTAGNRARIRPFEFHKDQWYDPEI